MVIDDIRKLVAAELMLFDRQFQQTLKSDVFLLNLITRYVLKTRGKQIRPTLVMLAAKMFAREVGTKTYAAAALIELLHTASLVHDDVVDEANERRGMLSVFTLWKSKTSVLFGDYLLARGLMLAVEHAAYDLLHIVSVAVKEMCEGEVLQLQYSRKQDVTEEAYFDVIYKKTAVLTGACTEAGAQSAGATPEETARMREFGVTLGFIFQIRDDLFDYQPHGVTGKPSGNDIRQKKLTLPLIAAMRQATNAEKRQIMSVLHGGMPDAQKLNVISRFVDDKGGLAYCRSAMNDLVQKAIAIIDGFPQGEVQTALREIVYFAMNRTK